MYETSYQEKGLLVLVQLEKKDLWPLEEQIEEFKNLVFSAGIEVIRLEVVKRKEISSALYIGKGKAEELGRIVEITEVNVVIFNNNLSFTQQRNLEDILKVKTIDRTQLILDIFARHAHTQEGALQVELAQLEYLLPRLKGKGIALSRLGGGIGTRGPGEKKLEVDRRRISDKIVRLKKELEEIRKHRDIQRRRREKEKISTCSLVGYTNAGKTTLFNALVSTNQKTSDSLFTTLDPVSRVVSFDNHFRIILSDTVGFIYKLPPNLVEAFKATLEELQYADILLHVVDSSSNFVKLISAVNEILGKLNLMSKHIILVFNKIDRIPSVTEEKIRSYYPGALFISALKKINLGLIYTKIKEVLFAETKQFLIKFPFSAMEILDYLYKKGEVFKVEYGAEEVKVWAQIKNSFLSYLEKKGVILKEI